MDPKPQDDEPIDMEEDFLIDGEDPSDPTEDELLAEFDL